MTNQRVNDVDTITTISSTDRILVNTDTVNNVLEQIEKDDFVADIISTDSDNLLEVGTDNKLAVIDGTITLQGNTFNGNSQLIQATPTGGYPALDGSLITNVSAVIDKNITQIGTCSTASATAEKAVTLSGFTYTDGITAIITMTNANTATSMSFNFNALGAKSLYSEDRIIVSATNPCYCPARSDLEIFYDTDLDGFIYKKRIVENYVNGYSWYHVYSDGWIEQGGLNTANAAVRTITLLKPYLNTNFSVLTNVGGGSYFSGGVSASINTITINCNTSNNVGIYWTAKGY